MLRGLDEPLNDRSDGPDHSAEDCPEQYGEDNVDDVEHDDGYLLWMNGWLGAGRKKSEARTSGRTKVRCSNPYNARQGVISRWRVQGNWDEILT